VGSVLMGVSIDVAKAKHEQKKEKKSASIDGLDYYLDKVKKPANIMIDVNVRYKEAGTDTLVTRHEKNLIIEDVQICNTPRPYFFGYKPNPLN